MRYLFGLVLWLFSSLFLHFATAFAFGGYNDTIVSASPFTAESTFLEVTIANPPRTVEDLQYDIIVTTRGFTTKSPVEIKFEELYKPLVDENWTNITTLQLVEHEQGNEDDITQDLKFRIIFNILQADDIAGGYECFIRIRFDILYWSITGDPVSFDIKMFSILTDAEFLIPHSTFHPFPSLAQSLDILLSPHDDNSDYQDFSIQFNTILSPISAVNGNLVVYSHFDTYHFLELPDSNYQPRCSLGNYTLPVSYIRDGSDSQPYIQVSLLEMGDGAIDIGSNVPLVCPGFIIDPETTTVHLSEYWIAHTTANTTLYSTLYVSGQDRQDELLLLRTRKRVYTIIALTILLLLGIASIILTFWSSRSIVVLALARNIVGIRKRVKLMSI